MRIAIPFALLLLACSSPSSGTAAGAEPSSGAEVAENPVPRERVVELFGRLEASRQDTSKDMLWGYFFKSSNRARLTELRPALLAQGYRFVEYLEPGDGDQNRLFYLHVERVETHSVDSLHQRNQELSQLASEYGVAYDGMNAEAAGAVQ